MFTVRDATPSDATSIAQVQVESWRAAYAGLIPDAVIAARTVERREAQWAQMLAEPERESVVVGVDEMGMIVGFGACGGQRDPDYDFAGELYALYLRPLAQRQGLGRALVCACADRLLAAGRASMLAWVLRDNDPARRFYERVGGVVVGEKIEMMDGSPLPEVAYGWRDLRLLVEMRCNGDD